MRMHKEGNDYLSEININDILEEIKKMQYGILNAENR